MTSRQTLTRKDVTGFCLLADGNEILIHRDICHKHPATVHEALGTDSESALQAHLDNVCYDDYFGADGEYLGADGDGLGLRS